MVRLDKTCTVLHIWNISEKKIVIGRHTSWWGIEGYQCCSFSVSQSKLYFKLLKCWKGYLHPWGTHVIGTTSILYTEYIRIWTFHPDTIRHHLYLMHMCRPRLYLAWLKKQAEKFMFQSQMNNFMKDRWNNGSQANE